MLQLRPTTWGHPRSRAAQGGRAGLWLTTAACVLALTLVRLSGQSYTCELLGGCDSPAVSRFSYSELLPSEQVEHSRTLAEEASGSGEGASGNDGELDSGSADISSGEEDSGDVAGDTGSGSGFFEPPAVPPPSPVPPLSPGESRIEVVEFELTLGLERRRLQAVWTDSLLADLHAALRQVLGLPRQNVLLTPVGSATTVHAIPGGGRTAIQIVQQVNSPGFVASLIAAGFPGTLRLSRLAFITWLIVAPPPPAPPPPSPSPPPPPSPRPPPIEILSPPPGFQNISNATNATGTDSDDFDAALIGISVGSSVLACCCLIFCCLYCVRRRRSSQVDGLAAAPKPTGSAPGAAQPRRRVFGSRKKRRAVTPFKNLSPAPAPASAPASEESHGKKEGTAYEKGNAYEKPTIDGTAEALLPMPPIPEPPHVHKPPSGHVHYKSPTVSPRTYATAVAPAPAMLTSVYASSVPSAPPHRLAPLAPTAALTPLQPVGSAKPAQQPGTYAALQPLRVIGEPAHTRVDAQPISGTRPQFTVQPPSRDRSPR